MLVLIAYAWSLFIQSRGQKFHSSTHDYEWNLERTSNSSQSTRPALRRITRGSHIAYYSLMFFIEYTFKGQVQVFAGRVKIVNHSSCRTNAILNIFVPCKVTHMRIYLVVLEAQNLVWVFISVNVCTSRDVSVETTWKHRHAWTFAAGRCEKYKNLTLPTSVICW